MFANSSIDISDCLYQDLNHIMTNSRLNCELFKKNIPISKKLKHYLNSKKLNKNNFISKGDDYQILFTSDPKNRSRIFSLSKKLNVKISKIGLIKKGKKIIFIHNMSKLKLSANKLGYIHNFN